MLSWWGVHLLVGGIGGKEMEKKSNNPLIKEKHGIPLQVEQ